LLPRRFSGSDLAPFVRACLKPGQAEKMLKDPKHKLRFLRMYHEVVVSEAEAGQCKANQAPQASQVKHARFVATHLPQSSHR
jgi:hypothetical protein